LPKGGITAGEASGGKKTPCSRERKTIGYWGKEPRTSTENKRTQTTEKTPKNTDPTFAEGCRREGAVRARNVIARWNGTTGGSNEHQVKIQGGDIQRSNQRKKKPLKGGSGEKMGTIKGTAVVRIPTLGTTAKIKERGGGGQLIFNSKGYGGMKIKKRNLPRLVPVVPQI